MNAEVEILIVEDNARDLELTIRALKKHTLGTASLPQDSGLVTSSAQERDVAESYRLGVNSYVVKPIDFDSFVKTIADLGFYWLAVNRPAAQP